MTSPEPTDYGPSDFFPIFDMAMNTDYNLTGDTTGLDYIYYVAGQGSADTQYDAQMLLRQFIAFQSVYSIILHLVEPIRAVTSIRLGPWQFRHTGYMLIP